jgi:uncharacterized membrane protein YgcG
MTNLTFLLMMQLVVSTKAGLVNHVQGATNLTRMQMVQPDVPITTGNNGYAEVLLTPGAFLRLDENSQAILESVDLANVVVHILRGAAVIEAIEVNKEYPIHVTSGELIAEVFQEGIFRFQDGVATVIQGKLRTGDTKLVYDKGWQFFYQDTYRAKKIGALKPTGLDAYSQQRSELIARANMTMLASAQNAQNSWTYDYWLFAPGFGYFTFLPRSNYRSPYGYRYYGVGAPIYRASGRPSSGDSGGGSGGRTTSGGTPTNNGGNSDGGGAPAGGGGGGVVVSTPAGQQTSPAVYIGGKNAPAQR